MSKRKDRNTDSTTSFTYYNLDTDVSIENLNSFNIFKENIDNKIVMQNLKYKVTNFQPFDKLKEYVSIYLFLVLLLFLLFLDFLHDFTNLNRKENQIFLNNKYKQEYKDLLIDIYRNKFLDNLNWINEDIINKLSKNTIEFQEPLENIILKLNTNIKLADFLDVSNLDNENKVKEKSLEIIKYLNINDLGKNLSELQNFKCNENLLALLTSANLSSFKNINFFIDADKSKYTMYPIVNKMCMLLFDRLSTIKQIGKRVKRLTPSLFFNDFIESITLQSSIVNDFDSATTPQLQNIITGVKKKYLEYYSKYNNIDEDSDQYKKESNSVDRIIKTVINKKKEINLKLKIYDYTIIDLLIKNSNNNINLLINQYFSINKNFFTETFFNIFLNNINLTGNIKKESSLSEISGIMKNYMIEGEAFYDFVYNFYTISNGIDFGILDIMPFYNKSIMTYNIKIIKKQKPILYNKLIDLYKPLYNKFDLNLDNKEVENEMINIMNNLVCKNGKIVANPNEIISELKNKYPNANDEFINNFVNDYWYHKDKNKFIFHDAYKKCNYDLKKLKKIKSYIQLLDSFKKIYSSKFNNIDDSLNNFMNNLVRTVNSMNNNYEDFLNTMIVLTSLKKTMGDFSQILYCNCYKHDSDNINIFFSFDIIATHISSLFNITLGENIENPLLPMKLLTTHKIISSSSSSSSFGKNNKISNNKISNNKIKNKKFERIIKLADKYNVSYKNLTYEKLYEKLHKLYKLQLLAKKLKIPITYMKQIKLNNKIKNKRFYKNSKILINEIKNKNKK